MPPLVLKPVLRAAKEAAHIAQGRHAARVAEGDWIVVGVVVPRADRIPLDEPPDEGVVVASSHMIQSGRGIELLVGELELLASAG